MTRPPAETSKVDPPVDGVSAGSAPGMFTAISIGRASQAIVDQIRILLSDGRLQPGDRLPSERELCNQLGVSRVTVREALRILETAGLLTIKVGAHGGAFVTSPTTQQVGAGLADLVSLSTLTAAEVTEARLVFEIGIVPFVVQRAEPPDVDGLRRMTSDHVQALRQGAYTMEMSADFHIAAAACSHNNAIVAFVDSFHGPLLMSLRQAKTAAPEMGETGCLEHVAYIDAIAARDTARAQEIMRAHLSRTAERLRRAPHQPS